MKWTRFYALTLLLVVLLSIFVRADDGNNDGGEDDNENDNNNNNNDFQDNDNDKENENDDDNRDNENDEKSNNNENEYDNSPTSTTTTTTVTIPVTTPVTSPTSTSKDSHGNACHRRAQVVSGECVCATGYSGDGKKHCGCRHPARFVVSPSATTTGAIIQLIVPAGAYNISIIGVDATYYVTANSGNWAIFQTDGTSKGAAMGGAYPWPVKNAAGFIYFQLTAPVTSSTFMIRYTYWINSATKIVSIVTDGVLVTPDTGACGQLDDLHLMQFGYTTAPRLGDMKLSWLPSSYQVEFDVTAWYEKDMAIVLVDTVEFNAFTDSVRVRPPGSCSAHAAMDASIPFPDLFQAAPTATSPMALNDGYLAYPDSSSTGWATSAINCSHVMYSRAFALSELSSCNNVIHSTGTDPLTGAAMLIYSGMIYIHTLQPAEDHALTESLGYAKFTQKFPWAAYIYTESEAIIQVSSDTTRIHVVVRNFELQGSNMFLQLETLTQAQGIELPAVRIVSATGQTALIIPDPVLSLQAGSAPCINNAETDMCTQQWIYRKPSWIDTDNQMYYFQWAVYGTAGADILTVPISLQLRVNDVKVVYGRLGDLSLSLYSDLPNASAKSANTKGVTYPWHVNERIFLRGDVAMNPTDVPAFTMSYTQLYICYSTVVGHDISLASGGCLDPTVTDASRVQLIANGAVQNSLSSSAFQTTLVSLANTTSTITSGVAFSAWPLTSEAHLYTIHAKVLVKSKNGKKREYEMLVRRDAEPTNSPASSTQLMIIPDPQQQNSVSGNTFSITFDSTTLAIGALSLAGVFIVVGLVIVATIIIRRRTRSINHV